jgi:predicted transcriptional regulator of viral defense system
VTTLVPKVTLTASKLLGSAYCCAVAREDRYLQLADIAANQWGMITAAQARQAQVNAQQIARLSTRGMLIRMQHGVYRLAGVPHDPMAGLKAAWLALQPEITARERLHRADPGAVASHRSAASLHHLGELDTDVHEFTIAQRRGTRHGDVRLHVRVLNLDEWQIVDRKPCSPQARDL